MSILFAYAASSAADFISKMAPVSAGVGGSAVFRVQVDGNPTPRVRWFRNGVELPASSRYRMSPPDSDGMASLTFDNLDEHDSGDITCEISTPKNKISCSAPLEVFGVFNEKKSI